MPIPEWLKTFSVGAGDVLAAVAGGFWGARAARAAEEKLKPHIVMAAEGLGAELKKRVELDRVGVRKVLRELGEHGRVLRALLREMNKRGGFLEMGSRTYYENWVVRMLQQIPPEDRYEQYMILNYVIVYEGRQTFFSELEILNNDGLEQWWRRRATLLERLKLDEQTLHELKRHLTVIRDTTRYLKRVNRRNERGWRRYF